MSWNWYDTTCPVCGWDNMSVYEDHKPCPIASCQCFDCWFATTTEFIRMDLDEVNEGREDRGDKPLTKKQYNKFKKEDFNI